MWAHSQANQVFICPSNEFVFKLDRSELNDWWISLTDKMWWNNGENSTELARSCLSATEYLFLKRAIIIIEMRAPHQQHLKLKPLLSLGVRCHFSPSPFLSSWVLSNAKMKHMFAKIQEEYNNFYFTIHTHAHRRTNMFINLCACVCGVLTETRSNWISWNHLNGKAILRRPHYIIAFE